MALAIMFLLQADNCFPVLIEDGDFYYLVFK